MIIDDSLTINNLDFKNKDLTLNALSTQTKTVSILTPSIKNMPDFDPDAEVSSLNLTIPSWISFIKNTQAVTDFSLISDKAKNNLIDMLSNLKDTADVMLNILKE